MPNQMIALQARGGRVADPARITAQYANMMTAARQAEAAQTQGALARQTMANNQASEARAATAAITAEQKAKFEYNKGLLEEYTDRMAKISPADKVRYGNLRQEIVKTFPLLNNELPSPDEWNQNSKILTISKASDVIGYSRSKPTSSLELAGKDGVYPENTPMVTTLSNDPNVAGSEPVYTTPPSGAAPTAAAPSTPTAGADMRATQGSNTTPRDLLDQGMDPRNIPSGMPTSPASFTGGMGGAGAAQMTPELMSRIADSAFQTGVIAQVDFDQLLATQPPENRQAFTDAFRQANITLQADAPSLADSGMGQQQSFAANPVQTPQSTYANLPPRQSQDTQPMMRQTMLQSQGRVIQPLQQKNPNVSPYPASAQVPLSRVGAEKTTEAQATKNVELNMAPKIAAATKKAERALELKSEAPKALSGVKSVVTNLDDYIDTIDRLLRSPDRSSIVGRFEGRIPYVLQDERQAELQADFDKIKNADTLRSLVEMKQASPSGGSPVGNASNQDVLLVARGANALVQTGGVPKFDQELKNIRRQAYRARQTAIEEYTNKYGELGASDPRFKLTPRATADRYISTKDLPKRKTPVIPTLTPDQVRAAPSGTVYMTTDGRKGTKP